MSPTNKIVIVGAGGFGRELAQLIRDIGGWEILGFLDDDPEKQGKEIGGLPVLGPIEAVAKISPAPAVALGVGFPRVKRKVVEKIKALAPSAFFPVLVHPTAVLGRGVCLGEGTVVTAGVILTVDINIGSYVLLNLLTTVGHDAVVGDYATLYVNVNLAGYSKIGNGVEMGTGSVVIPGKSVGEGSVVGAGAVVVKDIPSNVVAVGVPAKVIREVEEPW